MNGRYLAFDVETPNYQNDRISAIGLTVIEDGRITDEYYTLVDPQTHFDRFNIQLTGITPQMVADKPDFGALWPQLEDLMEGSVLVAHNAPFDLSVLAKCLRAYGIAWRSSVRYICTCRMSRRLLPQLPNHKLDTVSAWLGLELDHHHAGSDSRACGEILLHHLHSGAKASSFERTYDLAACRTLQGGR